jgi:diadenosine tetraphosphate (Ap4A) HIT family hydrolase
VGTGFELHPQLQKDCIILGKFPLCLLLLMNDSNYPWCILVPAHAGIREIHELPESEQLALLHESTTLARAMTVVFSPHKLNIAALGNVVPQLHVHHIARFESDAAWPAPVWGRVHAKPYASTQPQDIVARLCQALKNSSFIPAD